MPNPVIIPALADLRQDIAGEIPVDLIEHWITSDRAARTQEALLAPLARRGTVVKSDSAGLSKLTAARPLIEVLKLVNDPKRIIASFGEAIGGKPIGLWIADDTEMFYPETVNEETVIDAMIGAQLANRDNLVQVGMAIHTGTFFEIGKGLYGPDAELVEGIAENETAGGEIIVASPRRTFDYAGRTSSIKPLADPSYPAPFSADFRADLDTYHPDRAREIAQKYAQDTCIILVRVFHPEQSQLLDFMSGFVAANALITEIASEHPVTKVKSNGQLAIFYAESTDGAIGFATKVRDALAAHDWSVNVALTQGSVFLFPLESGGTEIAGGPVNIASKLAEDTDERSRVFVERGITIAKPFRASAEPFSVTRSGVTLAGSRL